MSSEIVRRRHGPHLHGEVTSNNQPVGQCLNPGEVRVDSVELLAVDWKRGPEQTGKAPVEAKRKQQGKDTEKEKGLRFEGYCGHCCEGRIDKRIVGRDMCTEWKLTLQSPRMWILRPSRHRCQWRH